MEWLLRYTRGKIECVLELSVSGILNLKTLKKLNFKNLKKIEKFEKF